MGLVSVITCTGFRPEAFKLCQFYMQRQTYKGDLQWIVVNDAYSSEEAKGVKGDFPFELYGGPEKWRQGINTQRWNMLEAIKHIRGDKLLIIEDEDYYKPTYIEEMVAFLDHVEIVGEANAKYYNLQMPGWKQMHNLQHASLCQTGIKQSLYPALKAAVDSGELYFDIHLWKYVQNNKIPLLLLQNRDLCLGVKGMPGRSGIGVGHKIKDYFIDSDLSKLKEWFGADAPNYLPFVKERNGRSSTSAKSEPRTNSLQERRLLQKGSSGGLTANSASRPAISSSKPGINTLSSAKGLVSSKVG